MQAESIRLYVPYSLEAPWIVRREVARLGTFASREDAVRAAQVFRSRLSQAYGMQHPPVRIQESDGSWRDL